MIMFLPSRNAMVAVVCTVLAAAYGYAQPTRVPAPSGGRAPLDPSLPQTMPTATRSPVEFAITQNRYSVQSKAAGGKKQTISIETPPELQGHLVYAYRVEEHSNIGQSNRWSISNAYAQTATLTLDVIPNCVTSFGIGVACAERGSLEVDVTFYMYRPVSMSNEQALQFIEAQRRIVPTPAGRGTRRSLLPWPAGIAYRDRPPAMSGGEKQPRTAATSVPLEEDATDTGPRARRAADYIRTVRGNRCSDAAAAQWIGLRNHHGSRRIVVTYAVLRRVSISDERSQDTRTLEPGASVDLVCSVTPGNTASPSWTYGSVEVLGARFE
jgi:hypothetical protein